MQRLSHYLPRLSQAGLRAAPSLGLVAKSPLPYTSLAAHARLASSTRPPSTQHLTDALNTVSRQNTRPEFTAEQKWEIRSKRALEDAMSSPPDDAYAGRSVKNTGNLAVAFRNLNEILTRNQVRQTVRMTERHEQKGAKRRRLQSERWRKQFANEVRKKVQLVIKIRNRGA